MSSSQKVIKDLYITLKRSFAGTPDKMVKTLKSLGLTKRHHFVKKPNCAEIRGEIEKVRHLVIVETDEMHANRLQKERSARALRPYVIVKHADLPKYGGNGENKANKQAGKEG